MELRMANMPSCLYKYITSKANGYYDRSVLIREPFVLTYNSLVKLTISPLSTDISIATPLLLNMINRSEPFLTITSKMGHHNEPSLLTINQSSTNHHLSIIKLLINNHLMLINHHLMIVRHESTINSSSTIN